jgi:cell division protein FtsX
MLPVAGAGAIVGIVFGVLGGVAIIIGASFFVWKKKFLEKNLTRQYDRTEGKLKLTAL